MENELITIDEEPQRDRTGPPWEHMKELGFFPAIWQTIAGVLTKPVATFANMRTEGGIGMPLMYALILGSIGGFVGLVWQTLFSTLGGFLGRGGTEEMAILGTLAIGAKIAIFAVLTPLFVIIGLFIGSGIAHVCLMIAGGANKSFETTYRVFAYTSGSTALIGLVPICGGIVAGIWAIVCEIIGLREAHETTTGKAVLAILLPLVVCCGGLIAIAFLVGGFLAIMRPWNW